MYPWRKGISLSFFTDKHGETTGADKDVLKLVSDSGFDCVELSFSHDDYFKKYHFTEGDSAQNLGEYCKSLGLDIWSIHLPFSDIWDLSGENAETALQDDKKLIQAAAKAHISVAVIHPSFEPIAERDRKSRLENAVKYLRILNQYAEESGLTLAVENLPRTCLGNTSEEMINLLDETGASFIFDTNHSLIETNEVFLKNMIRKGYCPVSLHISDYDFVDERHTLPGYGINHWQTLLDMLVDASYTGPAMYEVSKFSPSGCEVSLQQLSKNICDLLQGNIK